MFNMEVYIGDKESARKTAKKLGENVNGIYGKILGIINEINEDE